MIEFGIFNDEGLLEGGFYAEETAQARLASEYAEEDAHVSPICPEHPEHEAATCELCNEEEHEHDEEGE